MLFTIDGKSLNESVATLAQETKVTRGLFWSFVAAHVAIWTIVPALTQPNAPLDAIEMLYWGHGWQWGYYKHPPLPAWLSETCWLLFGNVDWPLYLTSQLCIAGCFWAAWRMASETLAPWPALAGAMLLEACYYYNFTTPEFNNNLPAKLFWALSILFLYWAIQRQRWYYWVALGGTLTLAMLSKYDVTLLIGTMLLFSIFHPTGRAAWKTVGPYLALIVSAFLITPHFIWLVTHNFPTLQYFCKRSQSTSSWMSHVINPAEFFGSQMLAIAFVIVLCLTTFGRRLRFGNLDGVQQFQRNYLIAMVFGPFFLALFASLVTGVHLQSMWGAAMWTYIGVLAIVPFQEFGESRDYQRLIGICTAIAVVMAIAFAIRNVAHASLANRPSRIHFPGRSLACEVEQRWSNISSRDLPLVAGDWWVAGNVAYYAKSRTHVYPELRPDWTPWTSDEQLRQKGGVIVWQLDREGLELSQKWLSRFPEAQTQPPIELNYQTAAAFPLQIGIAIIPGIEDIQHISNRDATHMHR